VGYQSRDLLLAMANDGVQPERVRVDGGMIENNWVAQNLADLLGIAVDRPEITETTALGAAYLAGLRVGLFDSLEGLSKSWQLDQCFERQISSEVAEDRYAGWLDAVARVRGRE